MWVISIKHIRVQICISALQRCRSLCEMRDKGYHLRGLGFSLCLDDLLLPLLNGPLHDEGRPLRLLLGYL